MPLESTSRNALLPFACLGLILAAAAAAYAAELTEEEKIIARHIEAVGGEDAIRAHSSMTLKGTFEMPAMGVSGNLTVHLAAPDKGLITVEMPGFGVNVQGFDGEIGWAEDPMQGARLLEDAELSQMKKEARIHGDLEYDQIYTRMSAAGESEWNGEAAHKLDLVDTAGSESSRYFALDTGLMIGEESSTTTEMGSIESSTAVVGYKEFGGLLLATPVITSIPSLGMEFVQTIESVTFGDVDPSVFEPSDAIKALLPE